MTGRSGTKWGQCGTCQEEYILRIDGRIRRHQDPNGWGFKVARNQCPGSHTQPIHVRDREPANGKD